MADNITANPGAGGATLASDDVAGVQFPRTKIALGIDGAYDGDVGASNPLPVALAAGAYAEDAVHASGATGLFVLGVQQTADAALAGDGDYAPLQVDELGRLKVANVPASQASTSGTITANGQTVSADVSRTSNIVFQISGTYGSVAIAFEASIDGGTNWFAVQAIRTDANTIETASGTLSSTLRAWELSVNGYTNFRVRATAYTSGTANIRIQPAPFATEPIPAAQVSGTQPVSGTVTANIGTGSLAAGTNAIGDVGIQARANATGAASRYHVVAAASTNAANIKASAGRYLGCSLSNTIASWRFVKLHNTAGTPTAGAAVFMTIGIPPNGRAEVSIPAGIGFGTGIGITIVTGAADADATAVSANDVVGDIFFA